MDLQLTGKNALVCAASEGIGKAIATGLAQEGANICIFSRTEDKVSKACKDIEKTAKGKVFGFVADLSNKSDRERINSEMRRVFSSIDILINNQGGPAPGGLMAVTEEQTVAAVETNLYAVMHLTKLCLPQMQEKQWGRIINILSLSGKESLPNMLLSNMLRPAILGFSKTLAHENAKFGITVNSLLPSAVLSARTMGFMKKAAEMQGIDIETAIANTSKNIPVGHIATPEEFSQLAVFLCSPLASFVTGTAVAVDGGSSKGIY